MQSRANEAIAVGCQHHHDNGIRSALQAIYSQDGIRGLWRGVTSSCARVAVGSASQLTTFTWAKETILNYQVACQISHVKLAN
jgi:solute carrier family 25, member 34/35